MAKEKSLDEKIDEYMVTAWGSTSPVIVFKTAETGPSLSQEAQAKHDAELVMATLDVAAEAVQARIDVLQEGLDNFEAGTVRMSQITENRIKARIESLKNAKRDVLRCGHAAVDRYYDREE